MKTRTRPRQATEFLAEGPVGEAEGHHHNKVATRSHDEDKICRHAESAFFALNLLYVAPLASTASPQEYSFPR